MSGLKNYQRYRLEVAKLSPYFCIATSDAVEATGGSGGGRGSGDGVLSLRPEDVDVGKYSRAYIVNLLRSSMYLVKCLFPIVIMWLHNKLLHLFIYLFIYFSLLFFHVLYVPYCTIWV